MNYQTSRPTEPGVYQWKATEQGRVHSVRVVLKKGLPVYSCKTMPVDKVFSGFWSEGRAEWTPGKDNLQTALA